MKGVVFTEFQEFVEDRFGMETAEGMLDGCELSDGGAFTSVGTYDHGELIKMLGWLSPKVGVPISQLVREFGRHLFGCFAADFPQFFPESSCSFEFIRRVDDYIHVEVRKLYPEAELPVFEYEDAPEGQMRLVYRSDRGMADLAEGLIQGCTEHHKERVAIAREDLSDGTGKAVRFTLTREK